MVGIFIMEIWKPIQQNENYLISNLGNVKTKEKPCKHSRHKGVICTRKERQIFPAINNGYKSFSISTNGGNKRYLLHRIIAETFIPNPENKPCVNHINGIKTDNRLENLEWVTHKENSQHAFKTGLNFPRYGMKGKIASLNKKSKKINQIDIKTNFIIKTFDSIHCVKRELNYSQSNICNCANGKRNSAYGYKWEYVI